MLVKDLIAKLQEQDPEAEVGFAYDYGDHWNTLVVGTVDEVTEQEVVYSDYHRSDKLRYQDCDPDEDQEDEDDLTDVRTMIILR